MNGQHVVTVPPHIRRQFERKRCISSFVFAKWMPIDPDCAGCHCAFKVHKKPFTASTRGYSEVPPVRRNELVLCIVEAVPGEKFVRVRQYDRRELFILKSRLCITGSYCRMK